MNTSRIRLAKVSALEEWKLNPRTIDSKKFENLKKRIADIGFNDVLKVAPDGKTVLGGNHRLRALKEMGTEDVYVLLTDAETYDEQIKVALSDNQEFAEYDVAALRLQLADHPNLDLVGYEINLTGGRPLSDVLGVTEEDDVEDDFNIDEVLAEEDEVHSTRGAVYRMNDHLIMCGDSTNRKDLETLMGEEKANLVFTDPPYMVDYHSASGRTYSSKDFGGDGSNIFNDNLNEREATEFYNRVLCYLYDYSTDNAPIYWWHASNRFHINHAAFVEAGWQLSQNIIWVKNHFVFSIGQDFHRMHEPCMFGWKKGNKHFKARQLNNIADTFVLGKDEFQDLPDVWIENRDKQKDYVHPTQKPVGLAIRALRCSSVPDDIVIDVFGGSGSTLMAAERLGRSARIMELDPKFVDAIRKRWARFMYGNDCDWQAATPSLVGSERNGKGKKQ